MIAPGSESRWSHSGPSTSGWATSPAPGGCVWTVVGPETASSATTSRSPLDDYFVANVRGWYRFANGMGRRVEVENVTDEEYELFQGWPMPGASVHVGADWVY